MSWYIIQLFKYILRCRSMSVIHTRTSQSVLNQFRLHLAAGWLKKQMMIATIAITHTVSHTDSQPSPFILSSGTPIFGICLEYAWYIPCICRCPTYTWYIHGIYLDIPCISIRVDDDQTGYTWYILGYTMYIH